MSSISLCRYVHVFPVFYDKTIIEKKKRKKKKKKLAIFLKMIRSKVMASFAHFVGVRRSCRALQFILTAADAAIATQKPNGKLNTAC